MTTSDLSDGCGQRLRGQEPEHGQSTGEEDRLTVAASLAKCDPPTNLAEAIRARFAPLGGVELDIPPREPMREPPDFE